MNQKVFRPSLHIPPPSPLRFPSHLLPLHAPPPPSPPQIDMDVLDDIAGEAAEIREANPWLYYSEPLHRLREFGSCLRELDLVDEAPLTSEQMAVVCAMLLSGPLDAPLPSPDVDFAAFLAHVKSLVAKSPLIFDPILRNLAPAVSLPRLAECYDGSHRKSSSCVLS